MYICNGRIMTRSRQLPNPFDRKQCKRKVSAMKIRDNVSSIPGIIVYLLSRT